MLLALMVTPGATCTLDVAVPADWVLVAAVESVPVDSVVDDDPVVDEDPVAEVVDAVSVPLLVVPALVVPVFDDPSPESVPVVSALATPGEVATNRPMPRAAASAPIRPTWRL
jgi:hypothetical protein